MNTAYERQVIARYEREFRTSTPYLDEPAEDPQRVPVIVTLVVLVVAMLPIYGLIAWVLL